MNRPFHNLDRSRTKKDGFFRGVWQELLLPAYLVVVGCNVATQLELGQPPGSKSTAMEVFFPAAVDIIGPGLECYIVLGAPRYVSRLTVLLHGGKECRGADWKQIKNEGIFLALFLTCSVALSLGVVVVDDDR